MCVRALTLIYSTLKGQKRMLDLLGLKLQAVVNFSVRAPCAVECWDPGFGSVTEQ